MNAKETGDEGSKRVVSQTVRVNFVAGTGASAHGRAVHLDSAWSPATDQIFALCISSSYDIDGTRVTATPVNSPPIDPTSENV